MKMKATPMKSRTNYLVIVENYNTDEISTAGYRTKKEAIKAVRAERGKYKSDKSYRGDPSGNGECFCTDSVYVRIRTVDSLVRCLWQNVFTVSIYTGDGSLSVQNFGKKKDAYRYFETIKDALKTVMTEKDSPCNCSWESVRFEGKDGKTVTLFLDWTVTTRLTEDENKSLKAVMYREDGAIMDYDIRLNDGICYCSDYLNDSHKKLYDYLYAKRNS